MRVFVAGATGAIGKQLLPQLQRAGHEVVAMTRHEASQDAISDMDGRPVLADALDPDSVAQAVAQTQPDVIVHELTALSGGITLRDFDRDFAVTNRLRTEGTDNLLSAGRAVGVRRFIAQSYAGWPFARSGSGLKTESDALDPTPVRSMRASLAAIRHLEETVRRADWTIGIVLRYGPLYGPGTSLTRGGEHAEMIRRRKFPIIGGGGGMWSFVHVADAAAATVAAVEHGEAGTYNVVDDRPVATAEWLPGAAQMLGAKAPWRVPRVLGRLLGGEAVVLTSTAAPGVSNAKAKDALHWHPRYPSWREGFEAELAA